MAKPVTEKQPFWQYGVVDFSDPKAVEYGAFNPRKIKIWVGD